MKIRIRQHYPYLAACFAFGVLLLMLLSVAPISVETYKQLRGSLFTGLFTVSGFLLSAKSLIILNMKKEIYAEEWYLDRTHDRDWSKTPYEQKGGGTPRADCGATSNVYRPLARVGALLSVNIGLALLASLFQVSIGLVETNWSVSLCLAMAVSALTMMGCSVYLMWANFEIMYAEWESIAQAKLEKKWADAINRFQESRVEPQPGSLKKTKTVEADEELPPV